MSKDLTNYRRDYNKQTLSEVDLPKEPIVLFQKWFDQVEQSDAIIEPNSMTLSTVLDGNPMSRVVLLKKYSEKGFTFFTNYDSQKGRAISQNPNVCLSFFWEYLERQVIILGDAEKISSNESDDYFHSRPIESRIGAIASPQSQVIRSRQYLESKIETLKKEYENNMPVRPKNWGGYLIRPHSIEFWQGRASRLHDRIKYFKADNHWVNQRLAP